MTRTHRTFTALALTAAIIFSLVTIGCGPQALARNADRVAIALEEGQPIIQSLIDSGAIPRDRGEQVMARMRQGSADARTLADAFRSGNNFDAINTTGTVIDVLETLINQDAQLIKDPGKRTLWLGILAAADIALHVIADNLVKIASDHALTVRMMSAWAPQQTQSAAEKIKRYAKQPKLRCRDAKSGRFQKMEVCKANPDTTVVERVK